MIRRLPRWFSWGLADQGLSSATNFGLTLMAGRVLGPDGLGVVFLGFALYLLVLVLHRSLVFEPLVVETSKMDAEERRQPTGAALTMTLLGAGLATALMVAIGLSFEGPMPRGALLFAPWIVPAMLQDLWRSILFRDDRGGGAAGNDAAWVGVMAVGLIVAVLTDSATVVVGAWGAGAVAGAVMGLFQTRLSPAGVADAFGWWRTRAWRLGRWLAGGSLVHAAGLQAVVFLLASVLGPAAIGGFRAVQTIFAPMTLLGPAAALPGLPRLSRTVHTSRVQARALAAKISGAVTSLAVVYIFCVLVGGSRLLTFAFGDSFAGYEELIVPMSIGQVLLAAALGFSLLLKAAKRGDSLMLTRIVATTAAVTLVPFLGATAGLIGAAWGFVAASLLENSTVIAMAWSKRFGALREEGVGEKGRPVVPQTPVTEGAA